MALSVEEYDRLERAIVDGKRLSVFRRGTEYVLIPRRLRIGEGKEIIEARHPSTGHYFEIDIADIDYIEVVK